MKAAAIEIGKAKFMITSGNLNDGEIITFISIQLNLVI